MSKPKKIFLKILAAVIAFALVFSAIAIGFVYFYIIPQYNQYAKTENRSELTGKDVFHIALQFSDKQFIENVKNFDVSSAQDVLNAMVELDTEENTAQIPSETDNILGTLYPFTSQPNDKPAQPTPVPEIPEKPTSSKQTAYERIMETADKKEISSGLAIISKVDISKINELRSQGKTNELKAYIKSCLSPSEISTALSLYNKYKNLL